MQSFANRPMKVTFFFLGIEVLKDITFWSVSGFIQQKSSEGHKEKIINHSTWSVFR